MSGAPPYLRGAVLLALARRGATDPEAHAAWHATVRAALAECGSIVDAAVALEIGRRMVERWIAADPTLDAGIERLGRGEQA